MPHRSRALSLTLAALILFSTVGAGLVGLVGVAAGVDPRFEADVPEPVLTPGETQQLTIQLTNDAAEYDEVAEPALDVAATVRGASGIQVLSGERALGRMGDGVPRSVTVSVDVPADIEGGTHRIPVVVEYRDEDNQDELQRSTVFATVRVRERARFAVESANASAPVGGSGTVNVTLRNVGERAASGAVVQFNSGDTDLTFGESATARRFVGDLAPNETRTVAVDATLTNSAETRGYAVDATVEYETAEGNSATSRPLSFGVTPLAEQSFDVANLSSTLRVGEEGQLRGRVTNTGEQRVTNAVVRLEASNPNVSPLEPEVAVGSLAPGESAEFAFDVEVSDAAEAGPRQFSLDVRYRDPEGTRATSDPIDAPVSVAGARDEFGVAAVNGSLSIGESGQFELRVTNNRNETVRDVSAKLFLDAPLSSSDDEAFAAELGPGETRTLTFDMSVAGSATSGKTYPAKVDFQYETAAGDTLISDTYQVPVTARTPAGNDLPVGLLAGVAGVLVVLVGAAYVVRSR